MRCVSAAVFKAFCQRIRYDHQQAASALGVSASTIRRYMNDKAPEAAVMALAWHAGLVNGWNDFQFLKSHIVVPDGTKVHRNVIANLEYYAYLQRVEGYYSQHIPAPAKNPRTHDIGDRIDWREVANVMPAASNSSQ